MGLKLNNMKVTIIVNKPCGYSSRETFNANEKQLEEIKKVLKTKKS